MSNVYIPYTPYNVLLSLAVAASRPDDDNFMILAGKDRNFLEGSASLLEIFHSVGMRAFTFESSWDDSNIKNFFIKKRNLRTLERELEALPSIDRLYYIREWNVYTTCAVHKARELNMDAKFYFLEDGIYTYVEEEKKLKNPIERLADRLAYGPWHINVAVPGALCPDAAVCAMFPDILPDIYKKRKLERIDLSPLLRSADEEVLARVTETHANDGVDTLVALSATGGAAYKNVISSFLRRNKNSSSVVTVKRHPNDDGRVAFIPPDVDAVELAPHVPVELFYFRYHKTLRRIIGGLSTALLTARRMLPDAEIESVVSQKYLECDEHADVILKLFKDAGVNVVVIDEA